MAAKIINKIENSTINTVLDKYLEKMELKHFEDVLDAELNLDRQLCIGEIEPEMSDAIVTMIRFWNQYDEVNNIPLEERKPIKVYINSPGGDINATFSIIDAIRFSETPVYTICTGTAYSGGFFIFIAGHIRYAYPHSSYMFHEGAAQFGGDATKFRNFSDFYQKQLDDLKDITLRFTSISEEQYEKIKKDDFWLTAVEAIELNVADRIIEKLI